jgi:transposase-like protein
MDDAEADVLAFMSFPKAHRVQIHSTNPLGEAQRRDQAAHECRGHLPQRTGHHAARRGAAARAERRVAATATLSAT